VAGRFRTFALHEGAFHLIRLIPFLIVLALAVGLLALGRLWSPWAYIPAWVLTTIVLVGVWDMIQKEHALRRNFPLVARVRWFFEWLRPFLRGYIVESETEGRPFNIEDRALVYRRAKDVTSVEPFGAHIDFDKPPYEWLNQSVLARKPVAEEFRVKVGGADCKKPYSASVFNISAMSFGALGSHAIEALNRGAKIGGFYHDTGEGGISRYHRAGGGDLVYEFGSGYFGCRTREGKFDPKRFADQAALDQVKMVEIKISQGAKPGSGGILPGEKVTAEIAEARGVDIGVTCESPPAHSAFSTPIGLMEFVARLRELSGGKPVGFKLCIGQRHEFLAMVKAMLKTGIKPDFIVVDGSEGGTGAAPAEFLDHVGAPLREGLVLVRNALVGAGLKDEIRLACAGKQISAFALASSMSLGADWVNTARGFMFALGCVQSLHCHDNTCPTGIATQDKGRQRGLVVSDKAVRVANFQRNTVKALADLVGAAGCSHPSELTPRHLMYRLNEHKSVTADIAYQLLERGSLLDEPSSTRLAEDWARAQAETFAPAP
jgi:glutamate synthase domain-containing protein 2